MGAIKDSMIGFMGEIDRVATGFVHEIAPILHEYGCDESPKVLVRIWDEQLEDMFGDLDWEFEHTAFTRMDCCYANMVLEGLGSFVITSMENDWQEKELQ